jgi:hypothetical protein
MKSRDAGFVPADAKQDLHFSPLTPASTRSTSGIPNSITCRFKTFSSPSSFPSARANRGNKSPPVYINATFTANDQISKAELLPTLKNNSGARYLLSPSVLLGAANTRLVQPYWPDMNYTTIVRQAEFRRTSQLGKRKKTVLRRGNFVRARCIFFGSGR